MTQRIAAALVLALVAIGCGPTQSPAPSQAAIERPFVLGCLSIDQGECELVAERMLAELPEGRSEPFTIQVQLFSCPNAGPLCPRSLAAREGMATVEFANREEPISRRVTGPPAELRFGEEILAFTGLQGARSERVVGFGPFPFELGHCGLTWMVDFDGFFWVPVGQVDGDASPVFNTDSGQMRLLGPDLAEYRNAEGFVAQLARFPGAKYIWGCD